MSSTPFIGCPARPLSLRSIALHGGLADGIMPSSGQYSAGVDTINVTTRAGPRRSAGEVERRGPCAPPRSLRGDRYPWTPLWP
jgi:hypothetical protein